MSKAMEFENIYHGACSTLKEISKTGIQGIKGQYNVYC